MTDSMKRLAKLEGNPRLAPLALADLPPEERRLRIDALLPSYLSRKTAAEAEAVVAAAAELRRAEPLQKTEDGG